MPMFDPPHPGEFITQTWLRPYQISARTLASFLDVSPSTISRVLDTSARVSPDMALRLEAVLGRSADSWLAMQAHWDLWEARHHTDVTRLRHLDLTDA